MRNESIIATSGTRHSGILDVRGLAHATPDNAKAGGKRGVQCLRAWLDSRVRPIFDITRQMAGRLRAGLVISFIAILPVLPAYAQQTVVQQPDCIIFFAFTAAGQTSPLAPNAGFSNLTNGCTTWNVSYANSGFSAISLVFQSAPNVSGAAGTWVTFANGTLLSGVNPNTNTTGTFTWLTGYNPWVRMTLASATGVGVVNGAVYGYRIPSAGATGTQTQNVNITGPLGQAAMAASVPVAIASNQSAVPVSGTVTANQGTANATPWPIDGPAASGAAPSGNPNWIAGLGSGATGGFLYPLTTCDSSAVVTVTAAATTQIVALTSGRSIRVCSFALSIGLAGTAQWVTGTGSNCGSGTTNLTGAFSIATGVTTNQGGGLGEIFKTPASQALCLAAVTGNVTGVVSYAVY